MAGCYMTSVSVQSIPLCNVERGLGAGSTHPQSCRVVGGLGESLPVWQTTDLCQACWGRSSASYEAFCLLWLQQNWVCADWHHGLAALPLFPCVFWFCCGISQSQPGFLDSNADLCSIARETAGCVAFPCNPDIKGVACWNSSFNWCLWSFQDCLLVRAPCMHVLTPPSV